MGYMKAQKIGKQNWEAGVITKCIGEKDVFYKKQKRIQKTHRKQLKNGFVESELNKLEELTKCLNEALQVPTPLQMMGHRRTAERKRNHTEFQKTDTKRKKY